MQNKRKSLFVTFEGGEGAGKTTLISSLQHALQELGYSVVSTREPGGTPLGEQIRAWLLQPHEGTHISESAELFLFLAARAQHIHEVIQPSLEAGCIVLCDRFNDSTVAYQGYARGLGVNKVEKLCALVCDSTLPTVTFFLDLEAKEGLQRRKQQSQKIDRIESEQIHFHEKVIEGMRQQALKYPERIQMLNASLPAKEVFKSAWQHLMQVLN